MESNISKSMGNISICYGGAISKLKRLFEIYRYEKSILEIGCACGNVASVFKHISGINYTGIDIDEHMINEANRIYKKYDHILFKNGNLYDTTQYIGEYDLILLPSITHHISDIDVIQLLKKAMLHLKPNGTL